MKSMRRLKSLITGLQRWIHCTDQKGKKQGDEWGLKGNSVSVAFIIHEGAIKL